ncbi:MAG: DUF350 domain-containing protein, partial [Myxococcota bacterium]|nr:DUF350 domain-containing protein [Myxococcota bacterium]
QVALIILAWVYQIITPYDDLQEIRKGNIAAALPLAGVLIAVGLTVESAVIGESYTFQEELKLVALYLIVASVCLLVLRLFVDRILMPGAKLSEEIARDRNAGAGLLEATSFIACAELVNYFLH